MVITRTPYRVSFFGGGTDYKPWYREHGGVVLGTTIDKYCHISLRPTSQFFDSKYRIIWAQLEEVDKRDNIRHAGVRGCLEYLRMYEGVEVNHAGDLPARSGLGSSSAFTVGMLSALHALRSEGNLSPAQLASEAIAVEQDVLSETVGVQDQIACAWGGFNVIEIARDGSYGIWPMFLPAERIAKLEAHLMLFYTGIQRHASEIAKEQVENTEGNREELQAVAALVPRAVALLRENCLHDFGLLLDESWRLKRRLSGKISSPEIDAHYARALAAGALGGKVLGAGGGGFMLFYVPLYRQDAVREALSPMIRVGVKFESQGSQVVLAG